MSETWKATKEGWGQLKASYAEADEQTRTDIWCWCLGLAGMAGAIIVEFGWSGALFVCGFVIWKSAGFK